MNRQWYVMCNVTGQRVSKNYDTEEAANSICRAMNTPIMGGLYGVSSVETVNEDDPLMLVCDECGEAFDSIATAAPHQADHPETGFGIQPASVAL